MEPFKLKSTGKDYLWGGTRLKSEFGKDYLDMEPLAETWECSTHPDGPTYVATGEFEGLTLAQLVEAHPEILGSAHSELPVLIKFIDAYGELSVQVHPDDEFAHQYEAGQSGKTEMWYVVDAEPGASLVYGFSRKVRPEKLREAIEAGTLERYLNRVPVHKNDVFYIPAGTVHAIGKGLVIAEIQQSSNLTYRLYDYNRVGKDGKKRELHVEKALAISQLGFAQDYRQPMRTLHYSKGCAVELLSKCPYFEVERWILYTEETLKLPALPESFRHLLCVSGEGKLGGLNFKKGDGIFIPADCGELSIEGNCEFLLTRA